jgi:hypothetical protein
MFDSISYYAIAVRVIIRVKAFLSLTKNEEKREKPLKS